MDLDTIGISLETSICLTRSLSTGLMRNAKLKKKLFTHLPLKTKWFDAYFQFDGHDASDEDQICLSFRLQPYDDDDNKLDLYHIYLGVYDRLELKRVMTRIANAL